MKKTLIFFLTLMLVSAGPAFAENSNLKKAIFAGGCFWCVEHDFDEVPGVVSTISGFAGGTEKNPTYKEVSASKTGHAESVEVTYDSSKTSYDKLLDAFWRMVDPTTPNKQFVDEGPQYRTVIFYGSEEEKQLAIASKEKLAKSGRYAGPIVTQIVPVTEFYSAEKYHQDYHKKNPLRYKFYRRLSGRDSYLKKTWRDA